MQRMQLFICIVVVATVLTVIDVIVLNAVQEGDHNIHDRESLEFISRTEQVTNKWVVVCIEEGQRTDLKFLHDLSGWNIVVVGHLPYLDSCKSPTCTYLHPGNIQQYKFRSASHASDPNFQIKNIGYLYAMSKSADYIYDLDHGVSPINTNTHFIFTDVTDGLIFRGNQTFNYYRYFGQPHLHPRGFPSSDHGKQTNLFKVCSTNAPLIQQGLVSGDPCLYGHHVRALLRITKQRPYDVQFDARSPPVFLPPGKISVVSSGNTVYRSEALWMLLLPSVEQAFISGLIRGYVSQRLSWETGGVVGFMGVTGYRKYAQRNMSNHSVSSEAQLAERVLGLVARWKCDRNKTLIECFIALFHLLVDTHVIDESNLPVIESWIYDVTNMINIRFSDRIDFSDTAHSYKGENCTNVYMAPNFNTHTVYNLTSMSVRLTPPWNTPFCPDVDEVRQALKTRSIPKYFFKDVLLVVIINYVRIYSSISTVENVYRRHFPHILYCGPNETIFMEYGRHLDVSHVEGMTEGWHFMYQCVALAMKMNYRVNGYLHIGDDTLVYLWNVFHLPRTSVWFPDHLDVFKRSVLTYSWRWWNEAVGRRHMESVFAELVEHSKTGSSDATMANQFFVNYVKNRQSIDSMYGKTCDFYYMPQKLKGIFLYVTDLLKKHRVMVELGLPTILQGLDRPEHIKLLPGKSLFGSARNKIAELFTTDDYYMHPVKFTPMFRIPGRRVFFCEKIQPLLEGSVQIRHTNTSLL